MLAKLTARGIPPLAFRGYVSAVLAVEGYALRPDAARPQSGHAEDASRWRSKQDKSTLVAMQDRLNQLEYRLQDLRNQQVKLDTAIAAVDGLSSIPRAADAEPSKAKKSKTKAAAGGPTTDRPCGFNRSLLDEFSVADSTYGVGEDDLVETCMISDRKCRRHHKYASEWASGILILCLPYIQMAGFKDH